MACSMRMNSSSATPPGGNAVRQRVAGRTLTRVEAGRIGPGKPRPLAQELEVQSYVGRPVARGALRGFPAIGVMLRWPGANANITVCRPQPAEVLVIPPPRELLSYPAGRLDAQRVAPCPCGSHASQSPPVARWILLASFAASTPAARCGDGDLSVRSLLATVCPGVVPVNGKHDGIVYAIVRHKFGVETAIMLVNHAVSRCIGQLVADLRTKAAKLSVRVVRRGSRQRAIRISMSEDFADRNHYRQHLPTSLNAGGGCAIRS